MWKVNSQTTVQVKTAVGMTDTALTGENLGQGSRSAAMVCSMSLSKSTDTFFSGINHAVSYGSVVLAPMLFQDDSMKVSTTVEEAREGCKRFEAIMDSKALEIDIDKSVYLLAGTKKTVKKIRQEITKSPLLYKKEGDELSILFMKLYP